MELSVTVDTAGFGEIGEIGIYSCKNSKCQVSIHTASRISRVASFVGLGLWLGLGLGIGLGSAFGLGFGLGIGLGLELVITFIQEISVS